MDLTQFVVVAGVVVAVLSFIVWPLFGRARAGTPASNASDPDRIEGRIGEYRSALRRGTACEQCAFPNREGARFCQECGARLPAAGSAGVR